MPHPSTEPRVSVITAVDPERAEYLPEVWESLLAQRLPTQDEAQQRADEYERRTWAATWGPRPRQTRGELIGPQPSTLWGIEWLVQCDSLDPDAQQAVRKQLPDDDRVSFGASRHGGPGVARTMALARARGELVKMLDADDRLATGVLGRDIAACSAPRIGWSGSRVVDVHPDGTRTDHRRELPSDGPVKPGSLYAYYRRHETVGTAPGAGIWVHPASLCARRSLVVALGGWMALPASEDTGLLLALDAVAAGWFHDEVGLYYRRANGQMSASSAHADPVEREARLTLITQRAQTLPRLCEGW